MDLIPVQREFLVEHPTVLGRSDDENKRLRINSIEILNEGDLKKRDNSKRASNSVKNYTSQAEEELALFSEGASLRYI